MTKKGNQFKTILSLFIPFFFIILKPLGMDSSQSIILGWLVLTVLWWITGWVYKDYASLLLLAIFILFGNTSLKSIFVFPLSDHFILIAASFLLSQGIVKSKVADQFSGFILEKYCQTSKRLVGMSFVLGILLIFVIPQPFPRIILLSSIYLNFLSKSDVTSEEKKVLLFSIFVASTVTSMMFLNGDIIINYAVMELGGVAFTGAEWIQYMTIPTCIITIFVAGLFTYVFKDYLKGQFTYKSQEKPSFTKEGKKALMITGVIILLWLTESSHNISASYVALFGVMLMFLTRVLVWNDVRCINTSLLLFLTAQFSIGKVLTASGIVQQLSQSLTKFFPTVESIYYIPFIILFIMVLHSFVGGLVTSVSVIIPMLLTMTAGVLSPQVIVLLTLVSVCFHYVLPFQHATIMIGYGSGYYENKHTIKLGFALTLATFVAALFVYIPWWKLIGLI